MPKLFLSHPYAYMASDGAADSDQRTWCRMLSEARVEEEPRI